MESEIRRHRVAALASGGDVAIQTHRLSGTLGDGPTVGICGAIHGNEPTGTEIIRAIERRYAARQFRGHLLLLPVANPLAYEANTRHTPLDDLNLNRLFPGNPDGWFSEQLAHVITDAFLSEIDVFIDLHAGGDRPTVDYVYIRNDERLSRAFGSSVLYRPDPRKAGTMFAGTSVSVTEARGVPSVVVELGGGVIDQSPYVQRGVEGIENMLRALDVIDEPTLAVSEQITVDGITTIRPHEGGILETTAPALGGSVEEGAVIGRVVDPHSLQVVEEIRNPVPDGIMILAHLTSNVVQPGDYAYMIGSRESL